MSGRRYVSPCLIALVLVGLGNKDEAFDWLGKSYPERGYCLSGLKGLDHGQASLGRAIHGSAASHELPGLRARARK